MDAVQLWRGAGVVPLPKELWAASGDSLWRRQPCLSALQPACVSKPARITPIPKLAPGSSNSQEVGWFDQLGRAISSEASGDAPAHVYAGSRGRSGGGRALLAQDRTGTHPERCCGSASELADLPPARTNGNITAQVSALRAIAEIKGSL